MAKPMQSVDPTLLALNVANTATQNAKKKVLPSLSTQAIAKPSLNVPTQQSQATFTPPTAKVGGISSPFGAPNINSAPILWWATPTEIKETTTQLQSLPKAMPETWTSSKIDVNLIWSLGANVMAGEDLPTIRTKYPELDYLDDNVLWSMLATMYDWVWPEEILQKFPELQWWWQWFLEWAINKAWDYMSTIDNPLINNKLTRGYMSWLWTIAGVAEKAWEWFTQWIKTLWTWILWLANKFDKAIGILPEDSQNADILASKLWLWKVSDKSLSQDILNVWEWTFSTAGNVLAPAVSFAFWVWAQTPWLNKALEWVSYWFTKLWETINKIPWLSNYRNSLPEEDQKRFDSLVWNSLLAFIWSKKGKLKEWDIRWYLDDNFWSIGSYDKAVADNITWLAPKWGIKSNFLANKLIGSKLKITDTNKKLVERASWVPATEFILNNDLWWASIDDMLSKTQQLSDDAMRQKLQAFETIKEPQPITQREKLMANSVISQAKNDIWELYWKSFDDIKPDEVLPELQEQFNIVKNLEDLKNSPQTTATKLQALQSLYDMYNSHLKYDLTKKRILWSQETIRLWMQKQLEELWNTVWVDIKDLNKKISWAKALEKWLIQAENRMDNNNMFWLSDTQTAILWAALWWWPVGVTLWLAWKAVLDNLWVRSWLAKYLYNKPLSNEWSKAPVNPPNSRPTARSNVSAQFGGSNTIMNSGKPNTPVVPPITVEKGAIGMWTPKTTVLPPKPTVAPSVWEVKNISKQTILEEMKWYKTVDDYLEYIRKALDDWHPKSDNLSWMKEPINPLEIARKKKLDILWEIGGKWWRVEWASKLWKQETPPAPKWFKWLWKETMEQNISKADDSLIQEAKKYKTADDMINSMEKEWKVTYHWTNVDFDTFDTKKLGLSTKADSAKKAIFFTNDKDLARGYWEFANDRKITDIYDKVDKLQRQWKWDEASNLEAEAEKIASQPYKEPVIKKVFIDSNKVFKYDAEWKWFLETDRKINEILDMAKSKWFDVVEVKNLVDNVYADSSRTSTHTMVLNPSVIKTESQLKQIREQANKKPLPPIPKKWK